VTLMVRLSPKASRDEIGKVAVIGGEAVLTVKVRALPEKGKANAALIALVAGWLKVPKSGVALKRGASGRIKALHIAGEPETLARRLEALLGRAR